MGNELQFDYAAAASFLDGVLPDSGKVAFLGLGPAFGAKGRGNRWLPATEARNERKLIQHLGGMVHEGARDLYFSHFSFDSPRRIQTNALLSRSLVCDIDVGDDKPYGTYNEGLAALVQFVETLGLEPTRVVKSGYGLHVYWVLDEAVPAAEWLRLARLFYVIRTAFGIREDSTTPLDESRVLRIPGTYNFKRSPVPVTLEYEGTSYGIDAMDKLLVAATELPEVLQFLDSDDYARMNVRMETQRMVRRTSEPFDDDTGVFDCPENLQVVKRMLAAIPPVLTTAYRLTATGTLQESNGPAVADYELWRSVIFAALSTRLTGIEDAIYEWASGSANTYSDWREATQKVIESDGKTGNAGVGVGTLVAWAKAYARAKGGYLPAQFEFLERHNVQSFTPGVKMGKTGNVLSLKNAALKVEDYDDLDDENLEVEEEKEEGFIPAEGFEHDAQFAVMPKGFFRPSDQTGVYLRKVSENKDGKRVEELQRILDTDLYVVARSEDRATGNMTFTVRQHTAFRAPKTLEFSMGLLADEKGFGRAFAEKGIVPTHKSLTGALMTYITKQAARLGKMQAADSRVVRFGWDEKCETFVLGETRFTPDGNFPVVSTASTIRKWASALMPAGQIEEWSAAIGMFDRPELKLCQMLIALSMGAPLIHPYGAEHTGGFVYLWSTNGSSGKTTMQRVMQGVWGDPTNPFLMGSIKTSDVTITNQMGALQDLSFAVDEGTTANTRNEVEDQRAKIADLIKQSTVGHGKMRSEQNGSLSANVSMWYAFTSISMNMSLDNLLGNSYNGPAAQRVVEVHYDVPLFQTLGFTTQQVREFGRTIRTSYGWAGQALATEYVRNKDKYMNMMRVESERVAGQLEEYNKESRFYIDLFASAHVALEAATSLGLLPFDKEALHEFMDEFVQQTAHRTRERSAFDIDDMLSQFIVDNRDSTVIVDAVQGKPTVLVGDTPRNKTSIRYNRSKGIVDIAVAPLMRYVRSRNLAWEDVVDFIASRDPKASIRKRDPLQGLKESTRSGVRMLRFHGETVGITAPEGDEE